MKRIDRMKKFLKGLSGLYHKIPSALSYRLYKNNERRKQEVTEQTMSMLCEYGKKETKSFFSYRVRPKTADAIPVLENKSTHEKCAIILQGPIMAENNFTLETVKLYRTFYPDAIILVSTWVDEPEERIDTLRAAGAEVVQSVKPKFSGRGNINFQLVSAKAGLLKARELGAVYLCKTRTDQRIYHPNILEFFINLIGNFSIDRDAFSIEQKARIICLSMEYGNMFYPFFMSDFLYFGLVDDICKLFDGELDQRKNVEKPKGYSRKEAAEQNLVAEIQIIRDYINRNGGDNTCSVKNYWNFIKSDLICINKDEIGLYWPKYGGQYCENTRNGYFYTTEKKEELKCYNWDFINWLNLYTGTLQYREEFEKYAEFVID